MGYRGVLHEFWGAEWCHLPLSLPGCLLFPDFRFNPLPGAHGSSSVLDTLKMGIEDSLWGKCGGSSLLLPPCNREQLQDIQAQPFPGKEIQGNCAGAVPSSAPECRPPARAPRSAGRSRRSLMALDGFFFQEFAAGWFCFGGDFFFFPFLSLFFNFFSPFLGFCKHGVDRE